MPSRCLPARAVAAQLEILPDRETATAAGWLSAHTSVEIVARDRGGGYAEAVTRALPAAAQVADRWHLMENASRAFLDAVRGSMRQIRTALGVRVIDPFLPSAAERLQYEGWLRRKDVNEAVLALAREGCATKEIVRRTGSSRATVRRILRGGRNDVIRCRQSSLEATLPWLEGRWEGGCRNGAALWRALRSRGFAASLRVVTEWATRRRKAERTEGGALTRTPSARTLSRLMTVGRDHLTKAETVTVAAIEDGVPALVEARHLVDEVQDKIRRKMDEALGDWLERAEASLVASFARGFRKDEAAVRAAITSPWSNGQTEGQITKLELVKRQMDGRGKIDLLQARLIGAG